MVNESKIIANDETNYYFSNYYQYSMTIVVTTKKGVYVYVHTHSATTTDSQQKKRESVVLQRTVVHYSIGSVVFVWLLL